MKSKLHIIVAVACALALTACGGGSSKTAAVTTPVVVQPTYSAVDTVVGTGAVATSGAVIVVNYTGYLYDTTQPNSKGAKIGSSIDTGHPLAFTLGVGNAPLLGWDQGILGIAGSQAAKPMQVGGKRTVIMPASLAFGSTAVTPTGYATIAANSPVIYDFELISVTTAPAPVPRADPTTVEILNDKPGTGDAAIAGKKVTLSYTTWLFDGTRVNLLGTQIDPVPGSATTTSTLTFTIGDGTVVPGFNTGVTGMQAGGSRQILVPAALGYGVNGSPTGTVPPNTPLVFQVSLTTIQ